MSRIIAATGKLAEVPYRIGKIERNIYSIEELCYSLVQSAQFLDTDIMDPALVEWIDKELGLPDLARRLQFYLGKERLLSDYVNSILNYVGYVSQDKQIRTRQIVASGKGMKPYETRMNKASWLADNGQSYQALAEYESILNELPEPERTMRTAILCQIALIYTELFRFRMAAEYYAKAYEVTASREIYLQYLAAVRFELPEEEYLAFIAEHPESHDASLELEERVQQANAAYMTSQAKQEVDRLARYRQEGQDASYEIALHQTIQQMKDDYRMRAGAGV